MKLKAVSGIILTLLLIGMLTLAFDIQPVKASGTIYIRADGSVDPDTAPISSVDNITYTFTGNINESIVIERDNIVVDGAGYTLKGIGSGGGLSLTGRTNVTIRNMEIREFFYGVYLYSSLNNSVSRNKITNNNHGIWLEGSSNNISGNTMTNNGGGIHLEGFSDNSILRNNITSNIKGISLSGSSNNNICGNSIIKNRGEGIRVSGSSNNNICGNNITNNEQEGIWLSWSSNNNISRNKITNNMEGIGLQDNSNKNNMVGNNITNNYWIGINLVGSYNILRNNSIVDNTYNFHGEGVNDVDVSNTVDGKPIYYWINRQDMTIPLDAGYVALVNCARITVQNLNLTSNLEGILLYSTTNSTITGNDITNNTHGIYLYKSSNNNISRNDITNNINGISLWYSSSNRISGSNITNNWWGIFLYSSSSNNIYVNNIKANYEAGIYLETLSSNNSILGNPITNNGVGVYIDYSSNNKLYHNSFISNTQQVHIEPYGRANVWDNGYPSGGNYWSEYSGVDVKSGPNQDQPSSDGIGDTPYIIDANNTDHYPLMYPWGAPPPPSYTLTIYSLPTGVTFTVDGVSHTTPWSGTYSEGTSVSLVMPETYNGYVWSHWQEDGDPNRIKTVTMDTDITLTAVYTRPPPPPPVGGKAIPIDKPIIKPELQIPWMWLSTIILPLIATAVFVKLKKKKQ